MGSTDVTRRRQPKPLSYVERLELSLVVAELDGARKELRRIAADIPRLPQLGRVTATLERAEDEKRALRGELAQVRRELSEARASDHERSERLAAQRRALDDLAAKLEQAHAELAVLHSEAISQARRARTHGLDDAAILEILGAGSEHAVGPLHLTQYYPAPQRPRCDPCVAGNHEGCVGRAGCGCSA